MEKRESLCTVDGTLIGTSTMESNEEASQNIRRTTMWSSDSTSGNTFKGNKKVIFLSEVSHTKKDILYNLIYRCKLKKKKNHRKKYIYGYQIRDGGW